MWSDDTSHDPFYNHNSNLVFVFLNYFHSIFNMSLSFKQIRNVNVTLLAGGKSSLQNDLVSFLFSFFWSVIKNHGGGKTPNHRLNHVADDQCVINFNTGALPQTVQRAH